MTVTLSLVVLKTRQLDALRDFYGDIGIKLTKEQHGRGAIHYSGKVGDAVLELYPLSTEATAADSSTRLGFVVEQLPELLQVLITNGTVVVKQPEKTDWGLRAVVRDPDGRAVELFQN